MRLKRYLLAVAATRRRRVLGRRVPTPATYEAFKALIDERPVR
ncbi:hypothetical protein BCL76_11386 [Streptomyces sp. CG 926]|nr:hypothetical protein [Streptomyces sp. CG 926]PWK65099.1 hypothetical protein BCL76_11386 [Streptomyces sp. CG 926]